MICSIRWKGEKGMGKTKHQGPMKLNKKPAPKLWASWAPMGLGKVKPKHIRDTMKTAWDNKDNLPYAYRIFDARRVRRLCARCVRTPRSDAHRPSFMHDAAERPALKYNACDRGQMAVRRHRTAAKAGQHRAEKAWTHPLSAVEKKW